MDLTDEHFTALNLASRDHLRRRISVFLGRYAGHEGVTLAGVRPVVDKALELSAPWPATAEAERTRLAHLVLCAVEQLGWESVALVQRSLEQGSDPGMGLDIVERELRAMRVTISLAVP